MPIFGHKNKEHHASGAAPTKGSRFGGRKGHHQQTYAMSARPTFGQWLKHTWLDILTMAAMGAIGLGVYFAEPAPSRSFPVTFPSRDIVWPEFGYPLRDEIIPIWLAALLASLVPIFVFLVMQIRVRSFWDVNNATIGLLYSLITAAVFQVFVKWLIGGLRPNFLAVCKPDTSLSNGRGYNSKGFMNLYYTKEICTGDKNQINDSLEAMPSGHTTAAFAGFIYLYLYLNAKLKVFSNYHPAMWKLVAVYAPVLGAVLIGGALTIDKFHNWYDVVAGAIIGTVFAFSSYRMTYAAIWDWRYNHIPLNRLAPFDYGMGDVDLADAVFTRKCGWGSSGSNLMHGSTHGKHHHGGMTGNGVHNAGVHNGTMGSGVGHNGMHDGTMGNGLAHDGVHHDGTMSNGHGYNGGSIPRRAVGGHGADNIV